MQQALAEARKADEALEKRLRAEEERAAKLVAERAAQERRERVEAAVRARREAAAKREIWSLGAARRLVREGYSVKHVMRTTGWPAEDLEGADRIFD